MPITFTPEQLDRAVRLLAHLPGKAQQAMARAMNRALEGARTTAAKAIRGEYRVSSRDVKATMRVQKATPANPQAEVVSTGKRIPLFDFGPDPDRPGTGGMTRGEVGVDLLGKAFNPGGDPRPTLRVSVKRRGGKKPIKKAFIARVGRVAIRKGKKRYPIRSLYGPAVPQMMGAETVIAKVEEIAQQRLDARLDHEIGWALEQADR